MPVNFLWKTDPAGQPGKLGKHFRKKVEKFSRVLAEILRLLLSKGFCERKANGPNLQIYAQPFKKTR